MVPNMVGRVVTTYNNKLNKIKQHFNKETLWVNNLY
jgi:hypothetical protein